MIQAPCMKLDDGSDGDGAPRRGIPEADGVRSLPSARDSGSSPSRFGILCRSAHPEDVPEILDLYNSVFATPRNANQWQWEFAENPWNRRHIVLGFAGKRLIGHMAGVPMGFRHEDRILRSARLQHAVVHPDYWGRGAFRRVIQELDEQMAAGGVDFVYAFPNRNSLPAMLRTKRYRHVLDLLPLERPLPLPPSDLAGTRVEISDRPHFDDDDVRCAERLLSPFAICNRRDRPYLNWRYHPASGRRYTVARAWRQGALVGWVVAKPYPPTASLDLVECILPAEAPLVADVLRALGRHFKGSEVTRVSTWSLPHQPMHACLRDLGFTTEPRPTHLIVGTLSAACSARSLEPSAYHLAMGDSDVY